MAADAKQQFAGCRRCVCVAAVLTSTLAAIIAFEVASVAGLKPSTKLFHVNIDVIKNSVGLHMSGRMENLRGGMASHLQVEKLSCDVYMVCNTTQQRGHVQFMGPITQAGNEFSADIAVHADNWRALKLDLQAAQTDKCGTCSFDLNIKLFSFFPVPVTVTRALSDLQESGDKEDKEGDDADSHSTSAEAQNITCDGLASLHGAPDRELGGTYCARVPRWLVDLSQKTGAGKVSLTLGSTQLKFTVPRMNGTWIVHTEDIIIPDIISSPVMEINASTSFDGFMASPAISLLADSVQYGNSSVALRPLREDTLGQLIGSHDLQSDVSPHGRQLNTDVAGLSKYAGQQMWNDLRDWCSPRWRPCVRFLGGWRKIAEDSATTALSGYLLDKLSAGMLTLPSARLSGMKTWEGESVVERYESGEPKHVEVSVGVDHFKLSMDMDELIGDDWARLHNAKITGTITMSPTLSDWLRVPNELRQGGKQYAGIAATFAVSNNDGTGQASLHANGNEMLGMSWKYTVGMPSEYAPTSNCNGGWSYHPFKGTLALNLRHTTSVDAEYDVLLRDFPFLDGGEGYRFSVWKDITVKDRIGTTVLQLTGRARDVLTCPPKGSIPSVPLAIVFARPSRTEMIKRAEASAAESANQEGGKGANEAADRTAGKSFCVLATLMAGMALAA
eukprot:TRINITY_DN2917_c0_g1_i3.p1 TRINITY_DN2917_c0_g1~~TRINITY_DN2917_c0_g1_i3.p1  ORF type:complete len:693 (-),score=122.08 TRINITY_DN2917_c0_g1_i3:40-2058(-)